MSGSAFSRENFLRTADRLQGLFMLRIEHHLSQRLFDSAGKLADSGPGRRTVFECVRHNRDWSAKVEQSFTTKSGFRSVVKTGRHDFQVWSLTSSHGAKGNTGG